MYSKMRNCNDDQEQKRKRNERDRERREQKKRQQEELIGNYKDACEKVATLKNTNKRLKQTNEQLIEENERLKKLNNRLLANNIELAQHNFEFWRESNKLIEKVSMDPATLSTNSKNSDLATSSTLLNHQLADDNASSQLTSESSFPSSSAYQGLSMDLTLGEAILLTPNSCHGNGEVRVQGDNKRPSSPPGKTEQNHPVIIEDKANVDLRLWNRLKQPEQAKLIGCNNGGLFSSAQEDDTEILIEALHREREKYTDIKGNGY